MLLVQRAVLTLGLLGDPGHRGVESHTGLDADHQQVEHVRQGVDDLALAGLDAIVEPEVREEEADDGKDQRDREQAGDRDDPQGQHRVEEIARAGQAGEPHLGAEEVAARPAARE